MCITDEIHYNETTYKCLISDILSGIQLFIFFCLIVHSIEL